MPCCKCIDFGWPFQQDVTYTDEARKKDYCLFHAPAEHKGMSVGDFNRHVFERIKDFKAKAKTPDEDESCNLSGTIFPGDISFREYEYEKLLPGIDFSKAKFDGKADFGRITFNGKATFWEATFSGKALFWMATFNGTADFSRATFDGMANFVGATFSDGAYFQETTFYVKAGKANFRAATFSNKADFGNAIFDSLADFKNVKAKANALRLHSLSSASLAHLSFTSVETECFSFKGCDDWPEKLWPEAQEKPDYKACEELYRSLKQKAAGEHDQPMVSKWHYREKLMSMRQKWYRRFVPITPTWLYWASSGFGERSVRAWWLLVGLCLVPFMLFGFEKILETAWSGNPDWKTFGTVFDEWSLCIPFVQTGFKGTANCAAIEPWKLRVAWIFQILIALQASLFAFALRNRFRR